MATGITEYAAGFEYVETERAISITRVFHLDPNGIGDEVIPRPGDEIEFPSAFETVLGDYLSTKAGIVCRQRSTKPLAGHPNKYEIIVTYSNEPVDYTVFATAGGEGPTTDIGDLPITLEYSGEFNTLTPESAEGWTWTTGGGAVAQPLGYRVNSSVLRFTRYVNGNVYDSFQTAVKNASGKVNSDANPFTTALGGGKGCWLFVGSTTEMFYNAQNVKFWRAELEFLYRNPDDTDEEGWQKIMRLDGVWDIPKKPDDSKLYETTSFESLLTNSQ